MRECGETQKSCVVVNCARRGGSVESPGALFGHAGLESTGGQGGASKVDVKMAVGKVKWFNDQKGYGFIEQENGGQDVFVHYSVILSPGYKTLVEGQEVEYELVDEGRGPRATAVTPKA